MRKGIRFLGSADYNGTFVDGTSKYAVVDTSLGSFWVPKDTQPGDVLVLNHPYRLILVASLDLAKKTANVFRLVNGCNPAEVAAHAAVANQVDQLGDEGTYRVS